MVLHAAMDSQTNQQAVVMLARKGGETFVSPSGIHSGTCLKLCRAREQDVVLQMNMLMQILLKLFQRPIQRAETDAASAGTL
jgi:hypothetical protein